MFLRFTLRHTIALCDRILLFYPVSIVLYVWSDAGTNHFPFSGINKAISILFYSRLSLTWSHMCCTYFLTSVHTRSLKMFPNKRTLYFCLSNVCQLFYLAFLMKRYTCDPILKFYLIFNKNKSVYRVACHTTECGHK